MTAPLTSVVSPVGTVYAIERMRLFEAEPQAPQVAEVPKSTVPKER